MRPADCRLLRFRGTAEHDEFQGDEPDDADQPDGDGEDTPGQNGGVSSAFFAQDAAQWAEQIRGQFSLPFETVQRQLTQQRPIFAEIARTIGDQQSQLFRFRLPKIDLPDLSSFAELGKRWRASLPENWRKLFAEDFKRLAAVARMTEPRLGTTGEVLSELLQATDIEAAEEVLTEPWDSPESGGTGRDGESEKPPAQRHIPGPTRPTGTVRDASRQTHTPEAQFESAPATKPSQPRLRSLEER